MRARSRRWSAWCGPHVAIITTIAASHLGHFTSLAEIADAKAEIFHRRRAGRRSGDQPRHAILRPLGRGGARGRHAAASWASASMKTPMCRLERVALHADCCCITADVMGETRHLQAWRSGRAHGAQQPCGARRRSKLAGADLARAALALATREPAKGRGVREQLAIARRRACC